MIDLNDYLSHLSNLQIAQSNEPIKPNLILLSKLSHLSTLDLNLNPKTFT